MQIQSNSGSSLLSKNFSRPLSTSFSVLEKVRTYGQKNMVFESGDQRALAERASSASKVNGEANDGIPDTAAGVCSIAGATAVAVGSFTASASGTPSIFPLCDAARCSSAFFNAS